MGYRLNIWLFYWLALIAGAPVFAIGQSSAELTVKNVQLLTIDGAIGPASSDYIVRAVTEARPPEVDLLVIKINTPGGLDKSMRDMIQAVLDARVPVVAYVYPQGARAASAGTYLLYACHVAAMAPATNLGAATPVQIGTPGLPNQGKPAEEQGEGGVSQDKKSSMERKQINDAVAYIRGLAELRGRNADWAEKAVREAASLSASKALTEGVTDIVAADMEALFKQLNGRIVTLNNSEVTLRIDNPIVRSVEPDWRNRFLSVITDPNVAYILMLLGIYGLVLEFYNPGVGVAGIVGAICLFLALYSFQVLPVSFAGVALILLGLGLMVAEAFAPSFGILGIGGVAAFIFGSIVLMDTRLPAYQIAMPLIAGLATLSVLVLIVAARMIFRSRHQQTVSGVEAILGQQVRVLNFADGKGWVRLQGEMWKARSSQSLKSGDTAKVVAVDGLELQVEPEGATSKEH